ncbi:MAG: tRNA (N6-isopentenyl adenosine(37)-C2)-methylthiotransferase MiaB [Vampirovibrionales bacterium]|nr:tRNA (N6-isopentenyl adenosine(37)-C2)-methylthiotransferase MiaB [Vampirovibrionales bacterium]
MTMRSVFIETLGCQMNRNDSELMLGLLAREGFRQAANPREADLVVLNSCQIRAQAEDKAYSYLGHWNTLKKHRPDLKIALTGCVAQQTGENAFSRSPGVDIVVGTQNLHDLPALVRRAFAGEERVMAVDRQKSRSSYDMMEDVAPVRQSAVSAWVTIIEGCDYFCTYCVVPYTRGRQISRPRESILAEARDLAALGYREITLLGQTVDSYGRDRPQEAYYLAHLLHDLHAIEGLARIRFMTSHPLDLDDALIAAVADLPRVMAYFHLPMQSGDDDVLARMKRGYTAAQYFERLDAIRARLPHAAISGDFIVGFPGETEAQFERTIEAVTRARFDGANTAAYSPRAQTPAGIWESRGEGVISDAVKQDRLQRLNTVITAQSLANNQQFEGQQVEVLVEGPSKRNAQRWTGRTEGNKVVNFDPPQPLGALSPGQLVNVFIEKAFPFSLMGYCVTPPPAPSASPEIFTENTQRTAALADAVR